MVQAIGTTLSAIGSTPSTKIADALQYQFNLWGNVLQATGNSLIADSEMTLTLDKIGNEIQAIGNVTLIVAALINFNESTKQDLVIRGNLLQATGGGVSLADTLGNEPSIKELYSIYGNLLQVIGNSLQAISGINEKAGNLEQNLDTIGSWIQAVGSIISAIGQSKYTK